MKKIPPTWNKMHRQNLKDKNTYISHEKREIINLKSGYFCPQCKNNVLAFSQPENCNGHD